MKEAQESNELATAAKYKALIAQNQKRVNEITQQVKKLPSQEEIQRSLTAIVEQANKS
jgi:hypothetical protein